MMLPAVMRGFSELYGSWKMICICRRIARIWPVRACATSVPSNRISPAVGLYSRRMQRPVVVLPQPDSPTNPSVSPRRTVKVTPSTALICATARWNKIPEVTGKCIFRSRTSSRTSSCAGADAAAAVWGIWAVVIVKLPRNVFNEKQPGKATAPAPAG